MSDIIIYLYMQINMLTLKFEKITGRTFLMSKAEITTLANVSCNLVSLISSRGLLCKNSPSYFRNSEKK